MRQRGGCIPCPVRLHCLPVNFGLMRALGWIYMLHHPNTLLLLPLGDSHVFQLVSMLSVSCTHRVYPT